MFQSGTRCFKTALPSNTRQSNGPKEHYVSNSKGHGMLWMYTFLQEGINRNFFINITELPFLLLIRTYIWLDLFNNFYFNGYTDSLLYNVFIARYLRKILFASQQILILLRSHMAVKWAEETRQQIPFLGSESARRQAVSKQILLKRE